MRYCVIVKLTRTTIEFRYQINNDQVEFLALNNSEQEIPLAFYLNGDELLMGKYAVERATCGDPYAYTDYFELIKDPQKSFKYANEQRPIKQLLYLGVERYLSFFLREKLLAQDSSIDANRPSFPLRICFGQDISSNERRFVLDQFIMAGYGNVAEVEIEPFLFDLISSNTKDKLMLVGINGDLIICYFNMRTRKFEQTKALTGMGVDPRYKKCAEMILEYIVSAKPYLMESLEGNIDVLMAEAKKILSSESTIKTGSVVLSNGGEYDYEINQLELKNKLSRTVGDNNLISEIIFFLDTLGVKRDAVEVVLEGDVNTEYFAKKLQKEKFLSLHQVTYLEEMTVWNTVFRTLDLTPVSINSKDVWVNEWNSLKSIADDYLRMKRLDDVRVKMHDFLDKVHREGLKIFDGEVKRYLSLCEHNNAPSDSQSVATEKTISESDRKKLNRLWRESKVDASSKADSKHYTEAVSILEKYIEACEEVGYNAYVEEARKMIDKWKKMAGVSSSEKPNSSKDSVKDNTAQVTKPDDKPVSSTDLKQLGRKWREVKALSKSKVREKMYSEAAEMIEAFLKEAHKINYTDCEEEAQTLLTEIKANLPARPASKSTERKQVDTISSTKRNTADRSASAVRDVVSQKQISMRIGRGGDQAMKITDRTVGRYHCEIQSQKDGTFIVEDLSLNGTFHNGVKKDKFVAKLDDTIGLGPNFTVKIRDLIK